MQREGILYRQAELRLLVSKSLFVVLVIGWLTVSHGIPWCLDIDTVSSVNENDAIHGFKMTAGEVERDEEK